MINLNLNFFTVDDFSIENKTVLLRVDFNSPVDSKGKIIDTFRIKSHLRTINKLEDSKVVLITHQGRPCSSDFTTTKNHSEILSKYINRNITYVDDIFGSSAKSSILSMEKGDIVMLENIRFCSEELLENIGCKHKNTLLVKSLYPLMDIFLNDAFSVSHRNHTSVVGFCEYLSSGSGLLMENEVINLSKVFNKNETCIYSLGGKKIIDSLSIIKNILSKKKSDIILLSGTIGNLALLSSGYNIGTINYKLLKSSGDIKYIDIMRNILKKYNQNIHFPIDVSLNKNGERINIPINQLKNYNNYQISDIGFDTIDLYSNLIKNSEISVLNGPSGICEIDNFSIGTKKIIKAATKSKYSIVGGGHILAEVNKLKVNSKFTHICSGGGACLKFLAGFKLPGLEALKKYYIKCNIKK